MNGIVESEHISCPGYTDDVMFNMAKGCKSECYECNVCVCGAGLHMYTPGCPECMECLERNEVVIE